MKQIAILEYKFIFDEDSPYRNIAQFERDLVMFWASKGMQADTVDVKGTSDGRVLFISKSSLQPPTPPSPKPMTFKKATPVGGK